VVKSGELLKVERDRDEKRDTADDERRRADEQAKQADAIAAWPISRVFSGAEWATHAARVQNNSTLPVWDVVVDFCGPDGEERASVTQPVVPPPGLDIPWPRDLRKTLGTDENGAILTEAASDFSVALTFRDAASIVWQRDRFGRIRKIMDLRFGSAAGRVEWKGSATGKTPDAT
jgi:hypothetical protein